MNEKSGGGGEKRTKSTANFYETSIVLPITWVVVGFIPREILIHDVEEALDCLSMSVSNYHLVRWNFPFAKGVYFVINTYWIYSTVFAMRRLWLAVINLNLSSRAIAPGMYTVNYLLTYSSISSAKPCRWATNFLSLSGPCRNCVSTMAIVCMHEGKENPMNTVDVL